MNKKVLLLLPFVLVALVVAVVRSLPDGKLHVTFCDVGQGDGVYIRMPSGADVVIDGGPDTKVLGCLGKKMPFYDRHIDMLVMTHPQKDHYFGLISILERYSVGYFVTTPVYNPTPEFEGLVQVLKQKKLKPEFLLGEDRVNFGDVRLEVVWPQRTWLRTTLPQSAALINNFDFDRWKGVVTTEDLNDFSVNIKLSFHDFDMMLTGDSDSRIQGAFPSGCCENIEVLKVPHHGSKTALTDGFLKKLAPRLSVVSVGRNTYGHPDLGLLQSLGRSGDVFRTDLLGNITFATDGYSIWRK